jgi:maltooligosyltrehalose trehalohydrolase
LRSREREIKVEIGAIPRDGGACEFTVFAPAAKRVDLGLGPGPESRIPLERAAEGHWRARIEGAPPGTLYRFSLDEGPWRPDPASRHQPQGVHGPSSVWDPSRFAWGDAGWRGVPLAELILYEIHIGTFTPEGTFDAAAGKLGVLKELGVNAVELMPIGQFPGGRNWGYDGVGLFAAQDSYGGPDGLQRFVDAAHGHGLAVYLDVVYNHLGPEGNYLREFGPYFTGRYCTPWGDAVNLDGAGSDPVREFLLANALAWLRDFHVDGLRLDAIHEIYDRRARHFLAELSDTVNAFSETAGFPRRLIAESDLNDSRVVKPTGYGGLGMAGQWLDDFHHCLEARLRGGKSDYAKDYGEARMLAKAYKDGFAYSGEWCPTRQRRFGSTSAGVPADRFVVFIQNHDQVGNRPGGERLASLAGFEALKAAAAGYLLSPYVPMLFMGEEWGETNPFLFFVSHSDPALLEAVREGRRRDFDFPEGGKAPDPASEEAFALSKIRWARRLEGTGRTLWRYYQALLGLRKSHPALRSRRKEDLDGTVRGDAYVLERRDRGARFWCALNFGERPARLELPAGGSWRKALDSADARWDGPGSGSPDAAEGGGGVAAAPMSALAYERREGDV